MATTDSNGVLFYQDTDNYTPIQTALNLAQSNLSNLLGGKPRFERVANTTARNALVSSVGAGNISKAHPLLVWRADAADGLQLEYTTNGSTWRTIADKEYYDAQAAAQDTGWQSVTLSAGFTGTVSYRVRQGWVQVYGDVSGTISGDSILAVLPAQARPTGGVLPFATYFYGGPGSNPVYADGASGNVRAPAQPNTTRRLFNGSWVAP